MINSLLPTMRVIAYPMKTKFRGITVREVAIFESDFGLVEFSPFPEYDDQESAQWLKCTLEAATGKDFPIHRSSVAMNGTIPESNDRDVVKELITSYGDVGTYKVKVGENLSSDIARLAMVRSAKPRAKIRIDVNGSWSASKAITNLRAIYENIGQIEYVEQPCLTLDELRKVKAELKVPIRIAADEVVRKATDPFAIDLSGAADIIILKVQPLGGIERSLNIAEHHQLPAVVSSALESQVGLNYGIRLAQSLPQLDFDCGLATARLFSGEGVDVSADRYEWWKNRVMRCAEVIDNE